MFKKMLFAQPINEEIIFNISTNKNCRRGAKICIDF